MVRYNMKAERVRAGLSLEQAASLLGIHPNTLFRWEHGEAEPLAENLVKLSAIYKCTPEYLLGMTDERDGRLTPAAM